MTIFNKGYEGRRTLLFRLCKIFNANFRESDEFKIKGAFLPHKTELDEIVSTAKSLGIKIYSRSKSENEETKLYSSIQILLAQLGLLCLRCGRQERIWNTETKKRETVPSYVIRLTDPYLSYDF